MTLIDLIVTVSIGWLIGIVILSFRIEIRERNLYLQKKDRIDNILDKWTEKPELKKEAYTKFKNNHRL